MRRTLVQETERQTLALLRSLLLASEYSLATGALVGGIEREAQAERIRTWDQSGSRDTDDLLRATDASGVTVWQDDSLVESSPESLGRLAMSQQVDLATQRSQGEDVYSLLLVDTVFDVRWLGIGIGLDNRDIAIWRSQTAEGAPPALGGVGELIQQTGQQAGINYIVLQSLDGIVFASRPLKPILKLAADSFLVEVLENDAAATRELDFEGLPVLEAAAPFLSSDLPSGVFRVGVPLTTVNEAVNRLTFQLALTALLLVLFSAAVSAVIVTRRSLTDLGQSYRRVETLTGSILDSIDQAVIAVDADGKVTVANPVVEGWFGHKAEEVLGKDVREILGDDDFGLTSVRRSGVAVLNRDHRRTIGRGSRDLVYSTTPLVTTDAVSAGAVAVIRDETDARTLAEQLRRGERLSAMGQLAAGVAHEVRNPLNAIALAAQRLRLDLTDSESRKLAETVWLESRRLNTIVEEFLSLARPSTLPKAPLDLGDLIRDVSQMARLEADKKHVTLRVEIGDPCFINGVADELRKAIWNLLTNALAATPPQGAIALSLRPGAKNAQLIVADTGEGIPPDALGRVFEPWFTTKTGGTGLGLAITHRIIKDHDGTIMINSPRPDGHQGTHVEVTLPLVIS